MKGGGQSAPRQTLGDSVTIGTAGKVFREPLVNKPGADAPKARPGQGDCRLEENTCSSSCQKCNPLSNYTPQQVKASADRVSFCNPNEQSSSIAGMIDHTLLKANATQEEIGKLCGEARKYRFASVCVNPGYVAMASGLLRGSSVMVCTVIGFPLGSTTPTVKAIEARDAIANGADEIDMVINIGALKSGNDQLVLDDIKAVRDATRGKTLKVILETSYLTKDEKVRACRMSKQAQADFVKTSTGFGSGGATPEDIALMRETVGPEMGVKASGGIKNAEVAAAMIKAGATRLGTSASIAIVSGGEAAKGQY
ncbi:MAG: deoxyribose-phosphate aldolase [Elusimicrobia bacterium CG08_land_8_20_14_0_20_59_10]|nr:MAG: deoxyribose-phosphate aldolase [Elusimicrobia bacterium CG08_land_8_20_14_0_20_59_10]